MNAINGNSKFGIIDGKFNVEVKPGEFYLFLLRFDVAHFISSGKINMNYKYKFSIKDSAKKATNNKKAGIAGMGMKNRGII